MRPSMSRFPRARRPQRPLHLFRFLAVNAVIGAVLGQMFLIALLASDAMGLGTLISRSADPWTPVALLSAVFATTFAAAVMGTAVMSLPSLSDHERR